MLTDYQACQPSRVQNLEIVNFKGLKLKELQPEPSEDQKKKKKKRLTPGAKPAKK